MKKQDTIRKFNHVQADLQYAGNMAKRTTKGARLGWLKKYVNLFGEYVATKKQVRGIIGHHAMVKMDKVEPLPKKFVFSNITKLEDEAWKQ